MHNEIRDFFARMKMTAGMAFTAPRVLECGSYDINGNPRAFFRDAQEYVGIDWRPGPGVDVVSLVGEYRDKPDGYFQFVIATSLLEHDPHWGQSIARMVDLLAVNGSILLTCGGPGFHQHELETSPQFTRGSEAFGSGRYYQNLSVEDVVGALARRGRFQRMYIEDDTRTKDIRVFAVGKMQDGAGVPAGWDARTGVPALEVIQ